MNDLRGNIDPAPLTAITTSQGQTIIMDPATVDFLSSPGARPTQAALDELLRQVHAVRVYEGGSCHYTPADRQLLAETTAHPELKSLQAALQIVDGDKNRCFHCMCCGDPTLEFIAADETRLALISIHHGRSVRWDAWQSDAKLVDGLALMKWLADCGVDGPIKEFAKDVEHERKWEVDRARWQSAMPRALIPVWAAVENSMGSPDVAALRSALAGGLPDENSRIRALLEWFGSGAGPWSGFPLYESAAEQLLLEYSTPRIVAAIESASTTCALREGAARLFAGVRAEC